MSCAPIVMFVYNRADHFEKTVTALSKCEEAARSDLYVFSDGAKSEAEEEKVEAVRQIARRIRSGGLFRTVTVSESETNRGLADSVIAGVTQILDRYEKVIVVEDDCVPSPYFLRFMNACLDAFKEDKRIGSVSGYAPPISFPADYRKDIFTAYRSCSWGWATWKDRWDGVDWSLESIRELYRRPELLKKFNSNGSDRFIRLYRQTKTDHSSWSVKFGYHLIKQDMLTVYPRYSYIDNIGCDSSGVHSKADDGKNTKADLSKAIGDPEIGFTEQDDRIQREMRRFYSGGIVSDIKKTVAAKAIAIRERRKR